MNLRDFTSISSSTRHINQRANQWHPWKGLTPNVAKGTRQRLRSSLRAAAFVEITRKHPRWSRQLRRQVSRDRSKEEYRAIQKETS